MLFMVFIELSTFSVKSIITRTYPIIDFALTRFRAFTKIGGTGGSHEELNMLEDSLMGMTGLTPRADSGYTSANANDEPPSTGKIRYRLSIITK